MAELNLARWSPARVWAGLVRDGGRLQAGEATDRQSITTAIEQLVDDFATGWLVGTEEDRQ